jgi:hypothetical protein
MLTTTFLGLTVHEIFMKNKGVMGEMDGRGPQSRPDRHRLLDFDRLRPKTIGAVRAPINQLH